jgi:hypothetical protein
MTGDNQTSGDPTQPKAVFGSDQGTSTGAAGNIDLDKILTQNQHAQNHIKTLESETAAMRAEIQRLSEELNKSRSIDDLLNEMRQQQNSNQPGSTAPQIDQNQLLETLKAEVFNSLTQAQQQAVEQQNWAAATNALRERFGDGYATYVDQRATELNLHPKYLESLAKTSPTAFMELVAPKTSRSAAPTMGSQTAPLSADKDFDEMAARLQSNVPLRVGKLSGCGMILRFNSGTVSVFLRRLA